MRVLRLAIRSYVRHSRPSVTPVVSISRNFCVEKAPAPTKPEPKHDWNRAMSDAEKIVGFVFVHV